MKTTLEVIGSGTVATVPQNAGVVATLGSHITGTVTGDGTPLLIHLDDSSSQDPPLANSWLLNAMQIREVPEPTSLALGLVSLMGLVATPSPIGFEVF